MFKTVQNSPAPKLKRPGKFKRFVQHYTNPSIKYVKRFDSNGQSKYIKQVVNRSSRKILPNILRTKGSIAATTVHKANDSSVSYKRANIALTKIDEKIKFYESKLATETNPIKRIEYEMKHGTYYSDRDRILNAISGTKTTPEVVEAKKVKLNSLYKAYKSNNKTKIANVKNTITKNDSHRNSMRGQLARTQVGRRLFNSRTLKRARFNAQRRFSEMRNKHASDFVKITKNKIGETLSQQYIPGTIKSDDALKIELSSLKQSDIASNQKIVEEIGLTKSAFYSGNPEVKTLAIQQLRNVQSVFGKERTVDFIKSLSSGESESESKSKYLIELLEGKTPTTIPSSIQMQHDTEIKVINIDKIKDYTTLIGEVEKQKTQPSQSVDQKTSNKSISDALTQRKQKILDTIHVDELQAIMPHERAIFDDLYKTPETNIFVSKNKNLFAQIATKLLKNTKINTFARDQLTKMKDTFKGYTKIQELIDKAIERLDKINARKQQKQQQQQQQQTSTTNINNRNKQY